VGVSGIKLGLWTRDTVEPKVAAANGGCELAFPVSDNAAVDQTHVDWRERGLKVAQPPTDMEFGRTFVALDPDGHRLRVFAPAAA
jgi:predicted enzyme related to lactoylglutathione lyase